MTFKKNFCPSPWFHMRITPAGDYKYCRWADSSNEHNIFEKTPTEFFQKTMEPIRQQFINGDMPAGCQTCRVMEQHNKISGRQKQLLKIGVQLEYFEKSLASSPWVPTFTSNNFTQLPQDWQIDLGNFCNGACIFCSPEYSSKLAAEWLKIGFTNSMPPANWCDDPELLSTFIETLQQSPHIQYLHFIGGETLITPAFKKILQALIEVGLNKTATIGFTTNLSVWKDDVVELLTQFQSVHLGMSVESFSTVNDYVRWPVTLSTVIENIDRWVDTGKQRSWLMQFRTTPTCLTVGKLLPIYEYALENNIIVESCNFLYKPAVLKPSVLPMSYRQDIIQQMELWISKYNTNNETIVNIRNPNTVQAQLVQDLSSYVNYLKNEPDESNLLPDLVTWLKHIESNRGNSVLTYLPEYEKLFKTAGY